MDFIKIIVLRILSLFIGIIFLSVIFSVIEFFSSFSNDKTVSKRTETTIVKEEKDNDETIVSRNQVWQDYDMNWYNNSLRVNYNDYIRSLSNKRNSNAFLLEGEYGLYKDMYVFDKSRLELVYRELDKTRKARYLSKVDFADMIVSMVQKMPYNVITQESCFQAYANDSTIEELMDSGYECDGNVYGGVYSPLEFVYENRGDCDSRTVFLFTLFKKFNYDVVILNSDFYAHSIIGLNIPSVGRYKSHLGKRYYTWETTAENWLLGDLPTHVGNMNYWYVALQ